jgi:hypothetical protein
MIRDGVGDGGNRKRETEWHKAKRDTVPNFTFPIRFFDVAYRGLSGRVFVADKQATKVTGFQGYFKSL